MLVKARRVREGPDLYNYIDPTLKTLTRDRETARVRDLKPDEKDVRSLYNDIHGEGVNFMFSDLLAVTAGALDSRTFEPKSDMRNIWYTNAVALEDEVLFPDETLNHDPKSVKLVEPVESWLKDGLDIENFMYVRWESESECSGTCGREEDGECDSSDGLSNIPGIDDRSSQWTTEDED